MRRPLDLDEILETPTDTPMVISWFEQQTGQRFAVCLRYASIRRDVVKVKIYCPWLDLFDRKVRPERANFLDEKKTPYTFYKIESEHEIQSAFRIMRLVKENVITGEEE